MQHINNKAEFEQLIKENNNVVIDFYATWCGPCKMLAPIIEQVANEVSHVKIVKVDVDVAGDLAELFGITSIPTVVYIKNQKLELRELGFKPKAAIFIPCKVKSSIELCNSFISLVKNGASPPVAINVKEESNSI